MEDLSREQLDAIERAKQQVVEEVQENEDKEAELEDVVGGTAEGDVAWRITISYIT